MSSPLDHVKDIPYLALSKNGEVLLPHKDGHGEHALVKWLPIGAHETEATHEVMQVFGAPLAFTQHSFSLLFVTLLLVGGALWARMGIALRPEGANRGVTAQFFETLINFLRKEVVGPNLGHHFHRYGAIFVNFFFLILFCNLWGMVPAFYTGAATANINITAALASIVFVSIFALGMYEQGPVKFWGCFVPPGVPLILAPMLFVIELAGPVAKCFALSVRLFANMVGGHAVLAAFIGLGLSSSGDFVLGSAIPGVLMGIAISCMEIFVAFLQAYVFTLLASLFVGSFLHSHH